MSASHSLFDDIIGHSAQISHCKQLVKRGSTPHAILFCGPEGVGKRTVARAFAAALLFNISGGSEQLKLIKKGNHPDLHFVQKEEEKKGLDVESIRTLCSKLRLKPYYSQCSVAIIDNAHQMNIAASNALLMTLEEPCANSYLFLITHAPHRLPQTIVSRCQLMHFGNLSTVETKQVISSLFSKLTSTNINENERPDDVSPGYDMPAEFRGLSDSLLKIAEGSIAPLQIDNFIDPKTLEINNEKRFLSHLSEVSLETTSLQKQIQSIIRSNSAESLPLSIPLSLASDLASVKDDNPFLWQTLHTEFRNRMRQASASQKSSWANVLLESLQTERLISERNTNPQLQLSSLLLKASQV